MEIELLKHLIAIIAYRFTTAVTDAPDNYYYLKIGVNSRSPVEIIDHMSHQLDSAIQLISGVPVSSVKRNFFSSENFEKCKQNFLSLLSSVDIRLDSLKGMDLPRVKVLMQGPLTDCISHIGQLAMLRRLAGNPVASQNFIKAKVLTGKLDYDI
ncbi:MAG: hypothetical protein KGZ71_11035 [Desulfobulbaceae bacterium]|nr:hypothetical protein [Candidatus Kapabacteria bacterium]MBS4001003.1 hypothetical protein [Desulfobulbaceae bacterium]